MATVAITVAAGGNAGATFRKLAKQIERACAELPDVNGSGASAVLTIIDNPAAGVATVQLTAGPVAASAVYRV